MVFHCNMTFFDNLNIRICVGSIGHFQMEPTQRWFKYLVDFNSGSGIGAERGKHLFLVGLVLSRKAADILQLGIGSVMSHSVSITLYVATAQPALPVWTVGQRWPRWIRECS